MTKLPKLSIEGKLPKLSIEDFLALSTLVLFAFERSPVTLGALVAGCLSVLASKHFHGRSEHEAVRAELQELKTKVASLSMSVGLKR